MRARDRFDRREEEGRVHEAVGHSRPMTVPGCSGAALAFGLAILVTGAYLTWRASARRNWPSVEGTATGRASVESGSPGRRGSRVRYFPVIEYSYVAGGRTYAADTVSIPTVWYSSRERAEESVRKRPAGTKVTVRHNPEDPGEAALEVLPDVLSKLLVWGGALLAGVGGLVFGTVTLQERAGRRRQRERARKRD